MSVETHIFLHISTIISHKRLGILDVYPWAAVVDSIYGIYSVTRIQICKRRHTAWYVKDAGRASERDVIIKHLKPIGMAVSKILSSYCTFISGERYHE